MTPWIRTAAAVEPSRAAPVPAPTFLPGLCAWRRSQGWRRDHLRRPPGHQRPAPSSQWLRAMPVVPLKVIAGRGQRPWLRGRAPRRCHVGWTGGESGRGPRGAVGRGSQRRPRPRARIIICLTDARGASGGGGSSARLRASIPGGARPGPAGSLGRPRIGQRAERCALAPRRGSVGPQEQCRRARSSGRCLRTTCRRWRWRRSRRTARCPRCPRTLRHRSAPVPTGAMLVEPDGSSKVESMSRRRWLQWTLRSPIFAEPQS
mmetsp:Transcript_35868/g.103218  ORF Transcript_35868/g.103218 Transcript_35868/m.103218 type:complete len:261 (+) Transcript_35868:573-1355(+)